MIFTGAGKWSRHGKQSNPFSKSVAVLTFSLLVLYFSGRNSGENSILKFGSEND
jgi:hypothetical protein